jgi:hypothetical protein
MARRSQTADVHPEDNGHGALFEPGHPAAPPPATSAPSPQPPDPFDPAALRLDANYAAGLGVKKMLTTVPVRRPGKQEWFRVRPGEEWRIQTAIFEAEAERETYLVDRSLWADLAGTVHPALIVLCVNRQSDAFLWRLKLPGADGRPNHWIDSALAIAREAETNWRRMAANMAAGYYDGFEPSAALPDPEWPDRSFREIIRTAFQGRMIDSLDHPLLRQLRGDS